MSNLCPECYIDLNNEGICPNCGLYVQATQEYMTDMRNPDQPTNQALPPRRYERIRNEQMKMRGLDKVTEKVLKDLYTSFTAFCCSSLRTLGFSKLPSSYLIRYFSSFISLSIPFSINTLTPYSEIPLHFSFNTLPTSSTSIPYEIDLYLDSAKTKYLCTISGTVLFTPDSTSNSD